MVKEQSNTPMETLIQVGSIRTRSMAEVSSHTPTEQLRKESLKMARSNIGELAYTKQFLIRKITVSKTNHKFLILFRTF